MNKLTIKFTEAATSNDHEAILLVDGEDWMGKEYMGMDPPKLFSQESLLLGGRTIIGRCNCGCEGCDDYEIDVVLLDSSIQWKSTLGYIINFDKSEYFREINSKKNDFTWENSNRTAERLVDKIFLRSKTTDGSLYEWSSARIKEKVIALSFSKDGKQTIFEFQWDGQDPTSARDNAIKELSKPCYIKSAQQGDAPEPATPAR